MTTLASTQASAEILRDLGEVARYANPTAPFVGVDTGECTHCSHPHDPEHAINGYWCGYFIGFGIRCDCVDYGLRMVPNALCVCGHWLAAHWYEGGGVGPWECIAEVGDGYCSCEAYVLRELEVARA